MVEQLSGSLSETELLELAPQIHVLGIRSKTQLSRDFFSAAKRLLGVGCFCIGTNQVDLRAAQLSGVPVFNAPFSNTRSVAELVLSEIVMLARQIGDRNREMHSGQWRKVSDRCYEVRGKTLGIIGYGHIGTQVGVLAESFGMRVLYYDIVSKMPMGNAQPCAQLHELLGASDFVSLHVPETETTKNMINAENFKHFKNRSYLLNLSRGSVVDLQALAENLKSGKIAGCAIDVYPSEPRNNQDEFSSPLRELPNVIMTPHIGGSTEEAQFNIGLEVSDFLIRFVNQGMSTGAVNFPAVDMPPREGSHRILNVHKNVPGVLAEINAITSELGANIQGQQLSTDSEIGYLVMDLDKGGSDLLKERISNLKTSIKTRILY